MYLMIVALAFSTGILVKATDMIEDDGLKIWFRGSENFLGVLYGIAIGLMISLYSDIAPLWIGIMVGVLLSGKIDARSHLLGMVFAVITFFILGIGEINYLLAVIFTVASFLEEKVNRLSDKIKILRYRPICEITALIVSVSIGQYEIFLSLLSFDIGYILTSRTTFR